RHRDRRRPGQAGRSRAVHLRRPWSRARLEGGAGAGGKTQTEGRGDDGMTLHIIKLCVGCDSVEDLRQWQREKLAQKRKNGEKPVLIHWTRMMPKRRDDVLDAGSPYWGIKGYVLRRHCIPPSKQG